MSRSSTKLAIFLISILGTVLSGKADGAPFLILPNGSTIYSSGIHIDGEARDLSYTWVSYDGTPVVGDVFMAGAGYLSSNSSESAWISPFSPYQHIDDVTLSVETTIDLSGINLDKDTFILSGFWVSDNQGLDILVNGVSTGQVNSGDHGQPPAANASNHFEISSQGSNLISGLNRIEFLWGNGGAGGSDPDWPNDPTHVRVELISYSLASAVFFDGFETGNLDAWSSSVP